jgi:hypothetical protein
VPIADAWIAMAAIAVGTSSLRLGATVTALARRRPWKVAREAITLDHLSRAVGGWRGWHSAAMQRRIVQAENTVVPALQAVESLGFAIEVNGDNIYARRGQEKYGAEDPVTLLGLIRLVELRSWELGGERHADRRNAPPLRHRLTSAHPGGLNGSARPG